MFFLNVCYEIKLLDCSKNDWRRQLFWAFLRFIWRWFFKYKIQLEHIWDLKMRVVWKAFAPPKKQTNKQTNKNNKTKQNTPPKKKKKQKKKKQTTTTAHTHKLPPPPLSPRIHLWVATSNQKSVKDSLCDHNDELYETFMNIFRKTGFKYLHVRQ